jgi:hypothetical protein
VRGDGGTRPTQLHRCLPAFLAGEDAGGTRRAEGRLMVARMGRYGGVRRDESRVPEITASDARPRDEIDSRAEALTL